MLGFFFLIDPIKYMYLMSHVFHVSIGFSMKWTITLPAASWSGPAQQGSPQKPPIPTEILSMIVFMDIYIYIYMNVWMY